MYIIMGVHHPKPGMEKSLLEFMDKFGKSQQGHRGLISGIVWKDDNTDVIVGLALWDTKEDYLAARPDMDKAMQGVDPKSLDAIFDVYRGSPILWTA